MPNEPQVIPVDPATTPEAADPNAGNKEPQAPTPEAPLQNPAPQAPEKKLSKRERLEFAKSKIEEQLGELDDDEDDSRPATMADIKRIIQGNTKTKAVELAVGIENVDERNAVIEALDRIVPSDNPDADFKLAQSMVNAEKLRQQLEDQARGTKPGNHANSPGQPGSPQDPFEPTPEEADMMRRFPLLTKEDVIAARRREQDKQG